MKKIILMFTLLLSATMFAQEVETPKVDSPKSLVSYYASVGLSITNLQTKDADGNTVESDFTDAAYPSVEFGVTKGSLSLGVIVGRGSLNFKDANKLEEYLSENPNTTKRNIKEIQRYYYELKAAVSQPVGNASVYALFGVGNYVDQNHIFIEYGAGIGYAPSKLGCFVQASNWDGIWYVTPGLSYTF